MNQEKMERWEVTVCLRAHLLNLVHKIVGIGNRDAPASQAIIYLGWMYTTQVGMNLPFNWVYSCIKQT